ncbi:hypothetical protein B0H19DRAFT_1270492 [Mycena capillaripes]|nr:hypothetical protein B0H19DRAFT_1270492 [Mycena capillaripes]
MFAPRSNSPPDITSFASLVFPVTDSPQPPTSAKAELGKSVIEWLFVVIAIVLVACLFLRKLCRVRSSFQYEMPIIPDSLYGHGGASFTRPSPADDPAYICTYVTYPRIPAVQLPYPLAVHSRNARPPVRPTRGPDIDDGGRRANSDMELVLSDKDMLPAYDGLDRPPRYAVATVGGSSAGACGVPVVDV